MSVLKLSNLRSFGCYLVFRQLGKFILNIMKYKTEITKKLTLVFFLEIASPVRCMVSIIGQDLYYYKAVDDNLVDILGGLLRLVYITR